MFNLKWVNRLNRTDWPDATSLARELFSMFTSKEAGESTGPLRISVPDGEAGLVVGRSSASSVDVGSSQAASVRTQRISEAQGRSLAQQRTTVSPFAPPTVEIDPLPSRPPDSADFGASSTTGVSTSYSPSDLSGAPRKLGPQSTPAPLPSNQVQIGPGFQTQSSVQAASIAQRAAKPYQSPVFEVQGETRFSGPTPVQFDAPPRVWNPQTDSYEPYDFDGRLTRIPLEDGDNVGALWGKVVLSSGGTAFCELHKTPSPDDDPIQIVNVTMANNINPKEQIPKDLYIYPVVQDDSGNWWGMVPTWF